MCVCVHVMVQRLSWRFCQLCFYTRHHLVVCWCPHVQSRSISGTLILCGQLLYVCYTVLLTMSLCPAFSRSVTFIQGFLCAKCKMASGSKNLANIIYGHCILWNREVFSAQGWGWWGSADSTGMKTDVVGFLRGWKRNVEIKLHFTEPLLGLQWQKKETDSNFLRTLTL